MKCTYFIKVFCLFFLILLVFIFTTCSEKKSVEPEDDSTLTISPDGGEYTFPDGIILRVPAGAVTEDTDIQLQYLNNTDLVPIFEQRGVSIDNLLACVEGTPDGTSFNFPVQLILSVDLEPGDIPIVHEVNIDSGSYTLSETEIICDPDQDTLVISLTHFSSLSAEIVKEFEELFDECGDTPCRCGRIRVEQYDKDYICDNGDCQVTETKVSVTFLDCPGTPMEESVMREVSEGCSPELYVAATNTIVPTGGQTRVSAYLELGCEPTEGQSVDFSLSNTSLASVNPTYSTSNSDGEAHTTFTAGEEEGTVTVTARSTVSYYTFTISASAGGQQETANGPLLTAELSQNVDIQIKEPDESWSGTMTFDVYNDYVIIEDAHYEIDYQFFVTEIGDSMGRSIDGTATATQSVTLGIGHVCWAFRNLNAPPTLNLIVGGYIPPDTNEVDIWLIINDDHPPFYEYATCFVCTPDNSEECSDPGGGLVNLLVGNDYAGDTGEIVLEEGTYSSSYVILTSTTYYTITLNRDESPASQSVRKHNRYNSKSEIEQANHLKTAINSRMNRR